MVAAEGSPGTDPSVLQPATEDEEKAGLAPQAQALLQLVQYFSLQQKRVQLDFAEFVGFVKLNLQRFVLKNPILEDFAQRTEAQITTYLRMLAERGLCQLEYDGPEVRGIRYPRFFTDLIHRAYAQLESRPQDPFPSEKLLGISLPPDLVLEVNIKTDFVNILTNPPEGGPEVLRLVFPENLADMLVTLNLVRRKLLELSLAKLREYLNTRSNVGFVTHRLLPALRGNEHVLRDTINSVITKSSRALASLTEPTDFSFRFWTHFVNLVIAEYRERMDHTVEELGQCQAGFLIGFFITYYRGLSQKESEKSLQIRRFENQFRKAPYAYTLKDLYGVKDERGQPLVRATTQDTFVQFLEQRTRLEGVKGLPEIVRLKAVNGQEYYLHRELIIPFVIKRLYERRELMRNSYIENWAQAIKDGRRLPAMYNDRAFLLDLEALLKAQDPLLHALLNYSLLFLAKDAAKISYDQAKELDRWLNEKQAQLEPLNRLFALERKPLLEDAKLRVPVWQRFALFKILVNWLRDLLRGAQRGPRPEKAPPAGGKEAKTRHGPRGALSRRRIAVHEAGREESTVTSPVSTAQLAAYRKAVQELKLHFVGAQKTVPERLGELALRWNPLYDSQARTELVEDVNSMIRDFLRGLRRGLRLKPPDTERIQSLAEQLSQNKAFDRIKRKDLFCQYIEVYLIKLLSEG
jgi:hypothetical protein